MRNNNKPSKNKSKSSSWIKNATKSVGFSSVEVLKSIMPTVTKTTVSVGESARDINNFVRNTRGTMNTQDRIISSTSIGKEAKDILSSAMDDLRTGNFSLEKMGDDLASSVDEFDFDNSIDDIEGDDSEPLLDITDGDVVVGKAILAGSTATVDSVREMTNVLAKTQIKSSEVASMRQANISMIGINKLNAGIMGINNRLDVINENLVSMINFQNENVSIMNQTTLEYYDRSIEMLNKLENAMDPDQGRLYKRSNDLDFMSDGFDVKNYAKFIQKNFSDSLVGSLISMASTTYDMSKMMGNEPLRLTKLMLEGGIKASIPRDIKKTLNDFDKNVSSYMENTLYQIGDLADDYTKNMFTRFMGEIFGAKRPKQKGLSMGDFYKDAMTWNGIAQKTLVEVIPEYLSNIESAILSQEKRYYDMDSGTFKKKSAIEKSFYDERTDIIQLELYNTLDKMTSYLEENSVDKDEIIKIQKDVNEILNKRISGDLSYDENYRKMITESLKDSLPADDFKEIILSLEKNIQATINSLNEQTESITRGVERSVYRNIFNDEDSAKINKHRSIDLFGSYDSMFARSVSDIRNEIMFRAQSLPEFKNVKNFKPSQSLIRDYIKAQRDPDVDQRDLDKLIRKELISKSFKKRKEGFFSKFRPKTSGNFSSTINENINTIDDFLFEKAMGFDRTDRDKNTFGGDINITVDPVEEKNKPSAKVHPKAASSRATGSNLVKELGDTNKYLEDQEKKFNKQTYDKIIDKKDSDIDKDLENNKALLLEESKITDKKFNELVPTPGDDSKNVAILVDANKAAADSIRASTFGMFSTFSNIVAKLFGRDGFFNTFFQNDRIKQWGLQIKDYLFDETDGLFSAVTVAMLDTADYIKYAFTGKGYTNRKGRAYPDEENSVFNHFRKGYDFIFSNTMKFIFGDENFRDNKTFQKYFSWMDIEGKKRGNSAKIDGGGEDKTKSPTEKKLALPSPKEEIVKSNSAMTKTMLALPDPMDRLSGRGKTIDPSSGAVIALPESLDSNNTPDNIKTENYLVPIQEDTSKTVHSEGADELINEAIIHTTDSIKEAGDQFAITLFGDKEPDNQTKMNFLERFKKSLPNYITAGLVGAGFSIATGGSLGLLGGLFLPSGPIGGAIAAMGLTWISKSKAVQELIFGKYDETESKKVGGIISQKMQDSFKKSMPVIVGGATLGALKHVVFGAPSGPLGLVTGALLPGGPIGGAILGISTSLFMHNEKVRKILFGEKDDDKRTGGLLSKGMNKFSAAFSKSAGFVKGGIKGMGVGAITGLTLSKMGVIGSALSLGGPIGMGITGLGLGIASATNRFQELLFGTEEIGPDGKPTGKRHKDGIMHQVRNSLVVNVFDPIQQKLEDEMTSFAYWAKEKIEYPFRLAFGPLLDALTGLKDDIGDYVKEKFDVLTDGINSLFKATIEKIFSPITKLIGKIGEVAIKTVATGARLVTMPLVGVLKIGSAIMRPQRIREEIKYLKNYATASKEVLTDKWTKEDEEGMYRDGPFGGLGKVFGRLKDVFEVMTSEARFEGREGYEEGMTEQGKNHLRHMSVKRERKELKEKRKAHQEEKKMWRRVDKLRKKYAKEDSYKDVFWTDEMIERRRKELIRAGLSEESLGRERDIKQLIFDKDDWKDKFMNPKDEAIIDSDGALNISETPEQKTSRERTDQYQDFMESITKEMRDLMKDLAGKQVYKDLSEKQRKRKEKAINRSINKKGFDKSKINVTMEELITDYDDIPSHEWDNYRLSKEYQTGDFKTWYSRRKRVWDSDRKINFDISDKPSEAKIMADDTSDIFDESQDIGLIKTKGHGNLNPAMVNRAYRSYRQKGTSKEDFVQMFIGDKVETIQPDTPEESTKSANIKDVSSSINDMTTQLIDRMDSQNEALFGGAYDRENRKRDVGKPIGADAIDRAHLSEEEIEESNKRGFRALFSEFFNIKSREDRKKARDDREAKENEEARALGKKVGEDNSNLPALIEEDVQSGALVPWEEPKKKKGGILGLLAKPLSFVGGVFGSLASWFSDSSNIAKLFLVGGGLQLFKDKFPDAFDGFAKFTNETLLPTTVDFISKTLIPKTGEFLTKAINLSTNFIVDYGPQMIKSTTETIITLLPDLITAGMDIGKAVFENTLGRLYNKAFGKDNTITDTKGAEKAKLEGKNVVQISDDEYMIPDSRTVFDENGEPTTIKNRRIQQATLKAVRNSAITPKAFTKMAKIGGGFGGGAVGATISLIPGVPKALTATTGARIGSKGAGVVADTAISTGRVAKRKVIEYFEAFFRKLSKLSNNKKIIKLFEKMPDGFQTFVKTFETKAMELANNMSESAAKKASAKIADATAESTTKTAGGFLSAGTLTAIFAGYDLITGAFEADKLFGVEKDEVDWIMRMISSLMKMLLGFYIGPIFDIILEVCSDLMGRDFKKELATWTYEKLSGLPGGDAAERVRKLKESQDKMDTKVEEYNQKNKTNLTVKAYQDMKNPNIVKRTWNKIKSTPPPPPELMSTLSYIPIPNNSLVPMVQPYYPMQGYGYPMTPPSGMINPYGINYGEGINYGYSQKDPQWSGFRLGKLPNGKDSTMKVGGCGPTALSTVASELNNTDISPLDIAQMAKDGGYIQRGGSTNELFTRGASRLGLQSTPIGKEDVATKLRQGKPVIISGKDPGDGRTPFTKAGHVIAATGIDSRGNVIASDPKDGSKKLIDLDSIDKHITGGWSYDSNISYGPTSLFTPMYAKDPMEPYKINTFLNSPLQQRLNILKPLSGNKKNTKEKVAASTTPAYKTGMGPRNSISRIGHTTTPFKPGKAAPNSISRLGKNDKTSSNSTKIPSTKPSLANQFVPAYSLDGTYYPTEKSKSTKITEINKTVSLSDIGELYDEYFDEEPGFLERTTTMFSDITSIFGKLSAIGINWLNSVFSGMPYERILDEEGNFLSGASGFFSDMFGVNYATTPRFKDQKSFIEALVPGAMKAYRQYGILPSVLIAQAALETGWGDKTKGNNLFGIKAGSGWKGKTQRFLTTEERNGVKVKEYATFRAYDSLDDSIMDYAKLMNNPRYSKVISAKSYKQATKELRKAGYATDSSYPQKLNRIIEGYGLTYYDNPDTVKRLLTPDARLKGPREAAIMTLYGDGMGGPSDDPTIANTRNMIDQLSMIEEAKMEMKINGVSYSEAKQRVGQRYAAKAAAETAGMYTTLQPNSEWGMVSPKAKQVMQGSNPSIKNWFTKTLGARISSDYGVRIDPFNKNRKMHRGIDFAAPAGTPISTPVSGTIIDTSYDSGYGNKVILRDNIGMYHLFGHMQSKSPVPVNSTIQKGATIGSVGTTGRSTGNHLHYEIRRENRHGTDVNPSTYNLNSILEGYGAMMPDSVEDEFSRENSKKMNINYYNDPSTYNGMDDISYGNADMSDINRRNEMIRKLDVALNADGVEDKLDSLIEVVRDGFGFVKERPDKEVVYYGDINQNRVNYNKDGRPILINNSSNVQDKSQQSLREIHEQIAKGR